MPNADQSAILVQLRAWLAGSDLPINSRLPPERELSRILGVTRAGLRKALAQLEAEGQLWRRVGKGTFTGRRVVEAINLVEVSHETNPADVMRARLLIEPLLAREAAFFASAADIEAMRSFAKRSRQAESWRQYETANNDLHRAIARASGNRVLLALFDALNTVKRTVLWGRLRPEQDRPPEDYRSFREHDAIIAEIEMRDPDGAYRAMSDHLHSIEKSLLEASTLSRPLLRAS